MTWCACPLCFSRIYLIKLTFCRVKYAFCLFWLSTEISHSKKLSCPFCNIIRGIETTTTSQKYLKQEFRAGLYIIQKLLCFIIKRFSPILNSYKNMKLIKPHSITFSCLSNEPIIYIMEAAKFTPKVWGKARMFLPFLHDFFRSSLYQKYTIRIFRWSLPNGSLCKHTPKHNVSRSL